MSHSFPWDSQQVIHYQEHDHNANQEEGEVGTLSSDSARSVGEVVHKTGHSSFSSTKGVKLCGESEILYSNDMNFEEALMAQLFQACDHKGTGRVKVFDLIEYLRTIVDMHVHEDGAVGNLIAILDPDNINAEIDSEKFHAGIQKWIDEMKAGNSNSDSREMSLLSSQENSMSSSRCLGETMESSTEESYADDKLSLSDLSTRLTDCQYLNRKLSEENSDARATIENKEEELFRLSRQLKDAHSEIKRLRELADFRYEAEAENEELRQQIIAQSKELDMERLRVHQTGQEKALMQTQLQRFQTQVIKLTSELALAQHHQNDLKTTLAEHKEKVTLLTDACSGFDAQLAERDERFQEVQACLKEFSKNNEDLKNQNQDLQRQLIETQQELSNLKLTSKPSSDFQHLPLGDLPDEVEEDPEQSEPTDICCQWPSSIQSELKELLSDRPDLPWPLSEKELTESVASAPDLVSQVGDTAHSHKHHTEGAIERKETSSDLESRADTKRGCKVPCDHHYDISNEKLRLLVNLLRSFKEENQRLRHLIKDNFMNKHNREGSMDTGGLATSAHDQAEEESEVAMLKRCLEESEKTIHKLQKYNGKLVLEVTKLKRSNIKLAEKLHKSELKICDLTEETQDSLASLDREKQRNAELEESLSSSTLARQLDLRDIWRLVQKDVEVESEDFQEDATEQLKEKIKKDIEALRTKLQKREAALGALKKNNLNLPLVWDNVDLNQTWSWCNGRKLSPGSPLVDALTIDVFNGNLPMYQPKYPYSTTVVSCEDVDCYECRAARLLLQKRGGSGHVRKLESLDEEHHDYAAASRSMEDWDMSPVVTTGLPTVFSEISSNRDRSVEDTAEVLPDAEMEEQHAYTDERLSESALASGDMPASMNHHSPSVKEVIGGHNGKDGPAHSTPERCIRAQEGRPPITSSLAHRSSSPSHTARRVTALAAQPTSKSSSSSTSSPLSLSTATTATTTLAPPSATGSPQKTPGRSPDRSEGAKENTSQTRINSRPSGVHVSEESSSSSEVETSKVRTVVPASPPTARNSLSVTQQAQPLGPSRLSKIRQNHLASKKREQMKTRSMKLPELAEHSELDTTKLPPASGTAANGTTKISSSESSSTSKATPQISITDEDAEMPPPPTDDPITPSLPESFLRKLGLSVQNSVDGESDPDVCVDQLPEKEIESKFVSLSLAFKTDKLTLDQRVSVQERSRDLAELNVDTELQGLREAVETLNELVSDDQVRSVIQKIKQHIDVLEQSAARVSSRAEVYGAVQQERRMCKAMEVMVLYTENLRRIREREESELQEARKVLSERSGNGYSLDVDSGPGRRSMSVCGFNASGRPMRRRSEVALPRVLGGSGSPSMIPGASLDSAPSFLERANTTAISQSPDQGEDPKSRFQSAVASTSMQHAITNTMRRCSLEKQRSVSVSSTSSLSPTSAPASPLSFKTSAPPLSVPTEAEPECNSADNGGDKTEAGRKISQDEDAFRKGFEQGLKAKLSQELNDLRDQQNSISQNLEHVMDRVDQSQMEEEEYLARPSRLETTLALASKVGGHILQYDWRSNKKAIRNIAGVFFVFLAFIIVFLSPPISTVDVRHFPKPPQ